MNTHARRPIGVLGGMGPLAGALFAYRVVQLTPATRDQEHVPVILRNDPQIPDRSEAIVGKGPSPLAAMSAGIDFLNAAGVGCIAIPCNTAHAWFDELQSRSEAPLLHIVEAAVNELGRHGIHGGKIGVMGTPGTLRLGLYQSRLVEAGYEPINADVLELESLCAQSIQRVKRNEIAQAWDPAVRCIRDLQARGARAVVLGCTELPLAVPPGRRAELKLPVIDSIDALARAAIEWSPSC